MDFLLGLGCIIPIYLFNKSVVNIVPKVKSELTLAVVIVMLFGTGAIMLFWALGLKPVVGNMDYFLTGLAGALMMNMGGKILHMLQNPID